MKNLLTYLLTEILGNNDFEIDENIQDSGFIDLKIIANPENMGLIIGKKGRMIKALRTILKTKATLDRIGFSLEVSERETR
jgi:predicted RNA-binding protein YlqC (UPF0109 family)